MFRTANLTIAIRTRDELEAVGFSAVSNRTKAIRWPLAILGPMDDSAILEAVDGFVEMTSWLWALSVAFFGVGDLLTTAVATFAVPIAEGSPTVGLVLSSFGFAGFVAVKLAVFIVAYLVWRGVGYPDNVGVPLALSVLGVGFTTWNLVVIGYTMAG